MSYDVSLTINTGGEYPATVTEVGNITWNLSPMFQAAMGCALRDLNGRFASEVVDVVEAGVRDMDEQPSYYTALNPENKWGNSEIARDFLARLAEACRKHPNATVEVS